MNIQFRTKNFILGDEDKEYIEKKIMALEKIHQDILNVKVDVEMQPHHKKGNIISMRVQMKVPHEDLVNVEERSTVREATDIIESEMRVQLRKHKEKLHSKNLKEARLKRT